MTKAKVQVAGTARNQRILPLFAASAAIALLAVTVPAQAQPAGGPRHDGAKVEKQVKVTKTVQASGRRDQNAQRNESRNVNRNQIDRRDNDRGQYENRTQYNERNRPDPRYESRYGDHRYDRRIIERNSIQRYGANGYYLPQASWNAPTRWRTIPGRIVSVGVGQYANCFTVLQSSYWNYRPALVTVQYCDRGWGMPYMVPNTRTFIQFTYSATYPR